MYETCPNEFQLYSSCVHYILSSERGRLLSIIAGRVARPTDQIVRSPRNVFAEAIKELVKLVLWSQSVFCSFRVFFFFPGYEFGGYMNKHDQLASKV